FRRPTVERVEMRHRPVSWLAVVIRIRLPGLARQIQWLIARSPRACSRTGAEGTLADQARWIADDRLQLRGQLRHRVESRTAFSLHLLAEAPMTGLEKHSRKPHATATPHAEAGNRLKPKD